MALSEDLVVGLTPEFLPPDTDLVSEMPRETDERRLRRWLWTQYLLRGRNPRQPTFRAKVLRVARRTPGAWHVGVGLIPWKGTDISFEAPRAMVLASQESGYVWGGIVLTSDRLRTRAVEESELSFENLRFPIIVRHAWNQPEAMVVKHGALPLGTVAAWAQTTSRHPVQSGVQGCVTAAHVAGNLGGGLDIEVGTLQFGTARPRWHSPPCLDAAFLQVGWRNPHNSFVPLVPNAIAAGDRTSFSGASTSGVVGYVTHISAHPNYTGAGFPMIVCHDGIGAKGDSGALVEVNGNPAAMHLGKILLDAGTSWESRGILLHQIARVMHLEFYR